MSNKLTSPKALRDFRDKLASARDSKKLTLTVCAGTGCAACGCQSLVDRKSTRLNSSHH
jgi:hypothetical protein